MYNDYILPMKVEENEDLLKNEFVRIMMSSVGIKYNFTLNFHLLIGIITLDKDTPSTAWSKNSILLPNRWEIWKQ